MRTHLRSPDAELVAVDLMFDTRHDGADLPTARHSLLATSGSEGIISGSPHSYNPREVAGSEALEKLDPRDPLSVPRVGPNDERLASTQNNERVRHIAYCQGS